MITIRTTFTEVVPNDSEEELEDDQNSGWENEEGEEFDTAEEVVDFLRDAGACHASSSHFHPGIWYFTEMEMEMYTGITRQLEYHIEADEDEEREIWNSLFPSK